MKLFIILLIVLILIILIALLCYNNKENFIVNYLIYPDKDIENREKWIKEYVNNTKHKKDEIYDFILLLTKQFDNIFYSKIFSNIINEHNNKIFKKKIPFIIEKIHNEFNKLYTSTEIEYIHFQNNNLLNLLMKYLECNYKSLNKEISVSKQDLDNDKERNMTENQCYKFIETSENTYLNLDKQNYKVEEYRLENDIDLIYKYFIYKETEPLINILRKKLFNLYIYKSDEYKPQYSLPCIFYDNKLCKSNRNCELLDENETPHCVPKYNKNKKLNNNPIKDCNSLSIYGKVLCERTENLEGQDCIWNEDMLKCLNNDDDSKVIECEDLRAKNKEELKNKCINHNKDDNNKSACQYLEPIDNKEHGLCYNKKNKNKMTCLNLSKNYKEKDEYIKQFNCEGNKNYYINNDIENKIEIEDLPCGIFDNSNYILDEKGYYIKKDKDTKYLGTDIDRQKELCESLKKTNANNTKSNKCKFIKRTEPLSGKTITKCIPKDIEKRLYSNYIDNNDDAKCGTQNPGYFKIDNNEIKCGDYKADCNDIKNKDLCNNRKDTCIWIKGGNTSNESEKGYCINQEFSEFENLIDYYHKEEIAKTAKFNNLKYEFNNLKYEFNNLKYKFNNYN